MTGRNKSSSPPQEHCLPKAATRKAAERTEQPGGSKHTPLDDRYAAGTPGGGTEAGGLAGSNIDEGVPEEEELHEVMGKGTEPEAEGEAPYSGKSGGAVGGTPAQGRSSGGKTGGGIAPGGVHRGDSTVGSDPDSE